MAQTTTGIRAVLSFASVYELVQRVMGADKTRALLINEFIKPVEGMKVLDVGCGPAEILEYLPCVDYYGFDISEEYIESAKRRFGTRGVFCAKYLTAKDLKNLPEFDVTLMFGVLHHLDDTTATKILKLVKGSLSPNGRLITIDPVFEEGQNFIAKYLISKDRGQDVRTGDGYQSIAETQFKTVKKTIRHQVFVPYTHCILECCKI